MISNSNIKVDRDLCTACGKCVDTCIMDNLRLSLAPCRTACPLHMNCQGYVRYMARGMEKEAAEELRLHTPFAAILGRICHHPCEQACERSQLDGAVHIRALKRYLADIQADICTQLPDIPDETGHRIAIVGSGPSGLMAGFELRSKGHSVTIFDKAEKPGGLMRYGIPSFRLPSLHVDNAVEFLEAMGVVFKMSQALGEDIEFARLMDDFDSVLLAIGTSSPARLPIPGSDLDSVVQGMDVLRDVEMTRSMVFLLKSAKFSWSLARFSASSCSWITNSISLRSEITCVIFKYPPAVDVTKINYFKL
ncbi:hypothetical protein ABF87_10860 [Nitrosomonas sp. JL21]|nr:hypothetical protein [Nitrosomonas sp. JL21]